MCCGVHEDPTESDLVMLNRQRAAVDDREIGASRGVKMYCIRMWRVVSVVLLARSYNLRASKVDYAHPMQEHLRAQASRTDSPTANESKYN